MNRKKNNLSPLVSIIIRTKNEERWINHCLDAITSQSISNFEIILVDNSSEDRTVTIAKKYTDKVVNVTEFYPGKAINEGIRYSTGKYIVILSGHCIPKNNIWLEKLIEPLLNDKTNLLAGVYGRQEPLSSSSALDKRDLTVVFGLDERTQKKDSFFHNANSALTRNIWKKFPFDENTTNIEDRLWGAEVIKNGYHIQYTPHASVYHYHGINQGGKIDRAEKIVDIIENLEGPAISLSKLIVDKLNIVGVIPIRGLPTTFEGRNLLIESIKYLKSCDLISEIYVSTDNTETANIAKENGALAPFRRPIELSAEDVGLPDVLKYTIEEIEKIRKVDLVVIIEENYPFRPAGLLTKLINNIIEGGYDTVCASIIEQRSIWLDTQQHIHAIGDSLMESRNKKPEKIHINLFGLGAVTYVDNIRSKKILTSKVGLSPVPNYPYSFQINDNVKL
jgi:rhamnosyltransferase